MGSLFAPWHHPARLARSFGHVALGMPIATAAFCVVVSLVSTGVGTLPVVPVGVVILLFAQWIAHLVGRVERGRLRALTGEVVADPVLPPPPAASLMRRVASRLRSAPRWREIAYCLAMVLPGALGYALVVALWAGSLVMLALPALIHAFPADAAQLWLFRVGVPQSWICALLGLFGVIVVAPWATTATASVEAALARRLLGPSREEELRAQVGAAETTRAAAVDAAEAERRRIERDLHDGAQQRLVALAADLGAAREHAERDPQAMHALLAKAHEEAKGALREIRDLVRGIHPVILEDRGLDAALSAVVARSPIPVALDVQVAERLPAPIESAAYFVVSEALTNVSRHSQATRAFVSIARAGGRLVIEVRDNGIGGADASRGTGLQGLRDRVAGLHGHLHVISPPGGPTTISVELPCAS